MIPCPCAARLDRVYLEISTWYYVAVYSQASTKSLFAALCAFLLLVGAVIGSNVAVSSSQTVSGCINKKTGALRIADECSKSERKIQWNIYGIQGEKGEQGQVGERGPQGKPGSTLLSGEGNSKRVYRGRR